MIVRGSAALAVLLVLLPIWSSGAEPSLRTVESTLLDTPSASGAVATSRHLNQEMHYAGTPGDRRLAAWMAERLRDDGFRATVEPFTTLVPQPHHFALQLLGTPRVTFDLHESAIPSDPDGTRADAGIPFNGWSASGTVTAPLVYAGRGLDADYRALSAAGVSVRGRIALVRYGAQFRGLLAQRAAQHGAAAVILYSDPADRDGSSHGAAYPNGPYRPLGSTQRGSVGRGMTIPVLPVNANVAIRLLRTVRGTPASGTMTGGLNVAYVLGASTIPVRLTVDEPFQRRTLWNTVGVLVGRDPTQSVVFGGHRDAWVYGVTDNGDGISTLLETARALGKLTRMGWQPRRSIIIAGWDGEEIGELGSIAYVHAHARDLQKGCIAYVNMDEGESGQFFGAFAAGAIARVAIEIAAHVADPRQPSQTLLARWQAQPHGAQVGTPGGGSDFESFLYDAGIPIIDWGFNGPFGVYHSGFDDIRYAMTEADPGFVNHRAMAQMLALAAYHLATEPLPALYRLAPYADSMRASLTTIAASSSLQTDVAPFTAALNAFAAAAARSDEGGTSPRALLDAVHRLDLLAYGRNGYASLPLPILSAAIATGNDAAIRGAAQRSAMELDRIRSELIR